MSPQRTELGFTHVFEPGTSDWTLLLLHGTGGDEHDLVGLASRLAPGTALLSPRGKVLEDGVSARFFRRLAPGRLDIPDLLARTDELAGFVAAAAHSYDLDATRIVALGYSNGANIAVGLLLRRPGVLRGAALLRPMLPYEPAERPDLTGADVLIAAGELDPYSGADQTARLTRLLAASGARVSAHVEPGTGHGVTTSDIAQVEGWLARLMGEPTTDAR